MLCRYGIDNPGGVEAVVAALSARLNRDAGVHVEVVSSFDRPAGVARWPLIGDLVASVKFGIHTMRRHFDVVLIHGAEYAWAPLFGSRLRSFRVVVVWHGVRTLEPIHQSDPLRRLLGRLFLVIEGTLERIACQTRHHIAVSEVVAADVRRLYGERLDIEVIHNGVDVQEVTGHVDS